jgi:hypothetical protein
MTNATFVMAVFFLYEACKTRIINPTIVLVFFLVASYETTTMNSTPHRGVFSILQTVTPKPQA